MAWRLGVFDQPNRSIPATTANLQMLQDVNKVLNDSISANQKPVKPVEPSKSVETKPVVPVVKTKPVVSVVPVVPVVPVTVRPTAP
jgi:hypothetical protein